MKTWILCCSFLFPCILDVLLWALGQSHNNFFSRNILDGFFCRPNSHCTVLKRKDSFLSDFP